MNPRKKIRVLVPLNSAGSLKAPSTPKRVLIFLLKVTLGPVFFLLGKVYKVCLGWLDESTATKNQQKFADEIRGQLPFLFSDCAAEIVPNDADIPFPPSFDGAYVTVATPAVRFQFVRGRGDFSVRVAPLSAPTEWEDLNLVVSTIPNPPIQVEQRDFYYLRTLARILPVLYPPLVDALGGARAKATLDEAANIHNKRMEEYVTGLKQNGVVPKVL